MPMLIVMASICVFVTVFAIQNSASVSLSFLFIEFESSLAFVTVTSFLCGILVAGCYLLILKARQYMKDRKTKEEMTKLQQEKEKLEKLVEYLKEHNGEMPAEPKPQTIRNPYIRK